MQTEASSTTDTLPEAGGALGGLRGVRCRFTLACGAPLDLADREPSFPLAVLRGALGKLLRDTVCITGKPTCDGCLLRARCAYGHLFETVQEPTSGAPGGFRDAPRPFVLHVCDPVRPAYVAGEVLRFDLTLLGRAADHLPYLLYASLKEDHAAGRGGRLRAGKMHLVALEAVQADGSTTLLYSPGAPQFRVPELLPLERLAGAVPPSATRVELALVTPLHLKRGGRPIGEEAFRLHHLVWSLALRLENLTRYYGGGAAIPEVRALAQAAEDVRVVEQDIRAVARRRFAHRQQQAVHMDGLVGPRRVRRRPRAPASTANSRPGPSRG